MICTRCNHEGLELAPLWPSERETNARTEVVMRLCMHCGLVQNNYGDSEILTPSEAAIIAPSALVPRQVTGL